MNRQHCRSMAIRLRLRPGADPSAQLQLPGPVALDLTVRRDWLSDDELSRLAKGGRSVRLTDADLRLPCPPDPLSTLSAFGARLRIDQHAPAPFLAINVWVVLEEIEAIEGPVTWLRGRIEGGTVRFSGLENIPGPLVAVDLDGCPLVDPFEQIWPASLGPVTGLLIGRSVLQLDVLDVDPGYQFRRRVEPVGKSADCKNRVWRMTFCPDDASNGLPLEDVPDRIRRKLRVLIAAGQTSAAAVQVIAGPDLIDPDLAYAVPIDASGLASPVDGSDLQLMFWGDGSGVPSSGKNLIIVGTDNNSRLHIRIFDPGGNLVTDKDETQLPSTQAGAISTLKQQLPGLLPPHVLTSAEKAQVITSTVSGLGRAITCLMSFTYDELIP